MYPVVRITGEEKQATLQTGMAETGGRRSVNQTADFLHNFGEKSQVLRFSSR
jgi:hypothetical protein